MSRIRQRCFPVGALLLASSFRFAIACTENVSLSSGEFGYAASAPDYVFKAPVMKHTFDLAALQDPATLHLTVRNVHGDFTRYRRCHPRRAGATHAAATQAAPVAA